MGCELSDLVLLVSYRELEEAAAGVGRAAIPTVPYSRLLTAFLGTDIMNISKEVIQYVQAGRH